jgi:transposase InsO family protein
MCGLAGVSRAGYYRFLTTPAAGDKDIDLRDAIQRVALEFPSYGRPRMTEELHRRGWQVGPNRVYRLMWEDNLLCLRRRKFVVTTNSNHDRPVYPNLARGMVLTGIDQLWVADITYSALSSAQFRRVQVPPVLE